MVGVEFAFITSCRKQAFHEGVGGSTETCTSHSRELEVLDLGMGMGLDGMRV